MFSIALALHNGLRWLVVGVALWTLARAYRGWLQGGGWTSVDDLAGRLLTIAFDVQLLVGVVVAALSPLVRAALQNPAAIGASQSVRYLAAVHIPLMMIAWVGVHLTRVLVNRSGDEPRRHRRATLGYSLSVALALAAIPWWRPLLPDL